MAGFAVVTVWLGKFYDTLLPQSKQSKPSTFSSFLVCLCYFFVFALCPIGGTNLLSTCIVLLCLKFLIMEACCLYAFEFLLLSTMHLRFTHVVESILNLFLCCCCCCWLLSSLVFSVACLLCQGEPNSKIAESENMFPLWKPFPTHKDLS